MLPKEYIPKQVDAIEAESIDNNEISSTTDANSRIVHSPGVCDENGAPANIITPIDNPTPDINVDE